MKIKSTSVYFGVVHVNKVFVIIHLVTLNKKLSYHRDSRNGDVGTNSLSL